MEFETRNPDYRNNIISKIEANRFMQHLGVMYMELKPGYMEAELELKPEHMQQHDFVHGGIIATMADIVMGFAAYTLAKPSEGMVTSDLRVTYLRPGKGVKMKAKGKVLKAGNLLYYCEADVICILDDQTEILIARASSTMCAIKL